MNEVTQYIIDVMFPKYKGALPTMFLFPHPDGGKNIVINCKDIIDIVDKAVESSRQ